MRGTAAASLPAAVAKTHRNLLPLFVVLVCVTYIDRTSLSFAALQLCQLPWFNSRVFGLGSAAFSMSYVLLQVPSNLVLQRVGPKVWLPLITAAWGLVSMCCAAIRGPVSFFLLRVALGATEAGCFPGMWWTCEQFYPPQHITFAYSAIEAAIAAAQILAAPLAAGLLAADGLLGLAGWQILFLAQGSITVAYAGVLWRFMPASAERAPFLDEDDRRWLRDQLRRKGGGGALAAASGGAAGGGGGGAKEVELGLRGRGSPRARDSEDDATLLLAGAAGRGHSSDAAEHYLTGGGGGADEFLRDQHAGGVLAFEPEPPAKPPSALALLAATARNARVWYLVCIKALKDCSLDALVYWTPVLIHALLEGGAVPLASQKDDAAAAASVAAGGAPAAKQCGGKHAQLRAVLLTLVPFGLAAAASLAIGHSSEVTGERRLHIGLPLLAGGAAFGLMPLFLGANIVAGAFVCVVLAVVAADATTGPFWSLVLSAAPGASIVALPAVNSLGKLGGAVGPASFGLLSYYTGSLVGPILLVAAALLGAGALAVAYRGGGRHEYSSIGGGGGGGAAGGAEDGARGPGGGGGGGGGSDGED